MPDAITSLRYDDLHRENVDLYRKVVALTERAIDDHADHGRELVKLGLASAGAGLCVGVLLGDVWYYAILALWIAQLGLGWYYHRADRRRRADANEVR